MTSMGPSPRNRRRFDTVMRTVAGCPTCIRGGADLAIVNARGLLVSTAAPMRPPISADAAIVIQFEPINRPISSTATAAGTTATAPRVGRGNRPPRDGVRTCSCTGQRNRCSCDDLPNDITSCRPLCLDSVQRKSVRKNRLGEGLHIVRPHMRDTTEQRSGLSAANESDRRASARAKSHPWMNPSCCGELHRISENRFGNVHRTGRRP